MSEQPTCPRCDGKGWMSPSDADRAIEANGELFNADYAQGKAAAPSSADEEIHSQLIEAAKRYLTADELGEVESLETLRKPTQDLIVAACRAALPLDSEFEMTEPSADVIARIVPDIEYWIQHSEAIKRDVPLHKVREWADALASSGAPPQKEGVVTAQLSNVTMASGAILASGAPPRPTLLDKWNYSGQPSVSAFNHAVDVANANYQRALKAEAAIAQRDARLAAIVQEMRRRAQAERDSAHFRDDSYDDRGFEHSIRAKCYDEIADQLAALGAHEEETP